MTNLEKKTEEVHIMREKITSLELFIGSATEEKIQFEVNFSASYLYKIKNQIVLWIHILIIEINKSV